MARGTEGSKPIDLRRAVDRWEEGAHLWASPGAHFKAGMATLIPALAALLLTRPLTVSVTVLTLYAFTLVPLVIAVVAGGWTLLSRGLLHLLRFERRAWVHYIAYALMGATALWLASFPFMALVGGLLLDDPNPLNAGYFWSYMWAAPTFGALGSLIGRYVLTYDISWHVLVTRPPLPDVFDFVEGRRDKDEFERM